MRYLAELLHLFFFVGILCLSANYSTAQNGVLDTFVVSIPNGQIGAHCYNGNSLPGNIVSVNNFCPEDSGSFAQVFIQNETSGCVDYFGANGGVDFACIEICDDLMNCDSFVLQIEVLVPPPVSCDPFGAETVINVAVSNCDQPAEICLPLEIEDIPDWNLTLNGLPYSNNFNPCQQDSLIGFPFAEIFGQGNQGPYFLDSWNFNDQSFSTIFDNIDILVDSLNAWNPSGNWEHNSATQKITGHANSNVFGPMMISAVGIPNTTTTIYPQVQYIYYGSSFYFGAGTNQFIATDPQTNCADTVQINTICAPTESVFQIVYPGSFGVICIDTGDLPGQEFMVRNVCEEDSGNQVVFDVFDSSPCINFASVQSGIDSACILICDELGFCDTTFVIVHVVEPVDGFVSQTILVGETQRFCIDTTELLGTVVQVSNSCDSPSAFSWALDTETYCISFTGIEAGTGTACMVLCDDLGGCDTTTYEINVAELLYAIPDAQSDYDTLIAGTTTVVDILANDDFETTDLVRVFKSPENGQLILTSELSFTYQPKQGFCGEDYFVYEICNARGECSQATVSLYVICDEVTIYSAFSPNGDGKNEFFVIEGLELYPKSVLYIFNRWGARVLEAVQYQNDWQGHWHNVALPEGTYFYKLELNDENARSYSGALYIAR